MAAGQGGQWFVLSRGRGRLPGGPGPAQGKGYVFGQQGKGGREVKTAAMHMCDV